MKLPEGSGSIDQAKDKLASAYQAMEMRLLHECKELANSGFADRRLSAAAHQKFEEAFLLLAKALRRGSPNDYTKAPAAGPYPDTFAPRADPEPERNIAERRHIPQLFHTPWRDLDDG